MGMCLTPSVHTSGFLAAQFCLVALIGEAAHVILIEEKSGGGRNVIGNHSLITRVRDGVKTVMPFWAKTVAKGTGFSDKVDNVKGVIKSTEDLV